MDGDLHFALSRFVLEHQRDFVVVLGKDGRIVDANRSARGAELDITTLFDAPERDLRIVSFLEELDVSGYAHTLAASTNGAVYRLEGTAVDKFRIVVARPLTKDDGQPPLGTVAATFIHDFNNLLMPILLLSGRLVRDLPEESGPGAFAADIHRSATIAAELAREVLAFSRPRAAAVERVDVNDMLTGLERLVRRLAGPRIEVLLALASDDALETRVDRKRLEHAVLTLVVGARTAMPDGGQLAISTSLAGEPGAPHVALSFTDTGIDVSAPRAVDGFSLEVRSTPGKGTRATLLLPAAPARRPESSERPVDSRVVMVAERDTLVRRAIQRVLEAQGWTVVAVGTQDEAVHAATAHPLRIAMLDTTIFRRSPTTFLQQLRALAPRMRFVLLTDHAFGANVPQNVVVLPKPFGDDELVKAIQLALD